ncbi:hypothetical protein ES708_16512 [subsurface metagenome]
MLNRLFNTKYEIRDEVRDTGYEVQESPGKATNFTNFH